MGKSGSTVTTLIGAALVAVAIGLAVEHTSLMRMLDVKAGGGKMAAAPERPARPAWTASAPGRVEPKGGEIRIGAQLSAKVADVLVRINDEVKAGDLLVRLQDDEAQARLVAAEAEVGVRRREREAETVPRLAAERRAAEDAVAAASRALHQARMEHDRLQTALRVGNATAATVAAARSALREAAEKLEQERSGLANAQSATGVPLPTRLESALTTARAELLLAETAIERTRIRAPRDGTVLQLMTKVGETVMPSAEDVLIVLGDVSALRVRAEVEERDVGKIRIGQMAVVRSDAFPGREFEGKVERVAQALGPPRMAARGPRKPSDIEVLEVVIDLAGRPPLLPGMRVDVFFKPDATVESQPPVKTN